VLAEAAAAAVFALAPHTRWCSQIPLPPQSLTASWEGGAVDGVSVNAFLAAALARGMRVAVPIPAVASASVFHSAAGGGSVVDVVRPI